MELIYKEDDPAVRLSYLLEDCLQPLLKLSPVFCSGHKGSEVKGKDFLILQRIRHIPLDYPLGQALNCRRLADTGFTYEHRVILCFSRKYPYYVPYLVVTAYNGVELLLPGPRHQVYTVFFQRIIGVFGIVVCNALVASDGLQGRKEAVPRYAVFIEDLLNLLGRGLYHRKEQVLHRDIFVPHELRLVLCAYQHLVQALGNEFLPRTLHLDALAYGSLSPLEEIILIYSHPLYEFQDERIVNGEQGIEQVLLAYLLIAVFHRQLFAVIYRGYRILSEFIYIHGCLPSTTGKPFHRSLSVVVVCNLRYLPYVRIYTTDC